MGRQSIWEYLGWCTPRNHQADRRKKQMKLDEFCANTHYHRKHALRLLNGPPPSRMRARPAHPRQRRHVRLTLLSSFAPINKQCPTKED